MSRAVRFFSPPWALTMWLRATLVALAVLALALALAIRLTAPAPSAASRLVGQPAPAFTLPAVSNGKTQAIPISLDSTRGYPTLVMFLYSLCSHCLSETETVHQLEAQHAAEGLRVLYVDSPAETPGIIAAYQQRVGITAPMLLDARGQVAARYGIHYYPALVLLDAHGIVRNAWSGEVPAATLDASIIHVTQAQGGSRNG